MDKCGGLGHPLGWGSLNDLVEEAMSEDGESLDGDMSMASDRRKGWSVMINGQLQRVFGEDRAEIDRIAPQIVASYLDENPGTFSIEWKVVDAFIVEASVIAEREDEIDQLSMELENLKESLAYEAW